LTAEPFLRYCKKVKKLSREQFLRVRRMSSKALDVARLRNQIALVFGRQRPEKQGEYLDLDLIAMEIVDRLTRFFEDRKDAAEFVRAYWPQWLITLARAEDAREDDYIFHVGARSGRDWVSQSLVIRVGKFDEVVREIAAMPADRRPTHNFYVDLWRAAEQVRDDAKAASVELDDRFFYSLDDPRCEAIIHEELRKHNDRIIRERKAGKPRAAKAKTLVAADVRTLIAEARGATPE
jgi:hypothetical protein